jgi:hypothetical protein
MFSRILVKLVDEAIVPAILLFAVRIIASLVVAKVNGISFTFGINGFTYSTKDEFLLVNSYSTLTMIGVLAVGLFFVLLKSYFFHDTHVQPHTAAKLFSLNLSGFIQTSFDVYSQGAVWLGYAYLLAIASGVMFYSNLIYSWVFYSAVIIVAIATFLLILDVDKELPKRTPANNEKKEDVVLRFEDEPEDI